MKGSEVLNALLAGREVEVKDMKAKDKDTKIRQATRQLLSAVSRLPETIRTWLRPAVQS